MLTDYRATATQAAGNWQPGNGASYLLHVSVVDAFIAQALQCLPGTLRVTWANHPTMPSFYMQHGALPVTTYIATKMGIDTVDAEAMVPGILVLIRAMKAAN